MAIRAVVFDIGGVLERVEDATWHAAALGLDEPMADTMMAEMWDAYCGELDQELFDWFTSLRGRVFLGILSNSADGARREESRRHGIPEAAYVVVYSHEAVAAARDAGWHAVLHTDTSSSIRSLEGLFRDFRPLDARGRRR